jgi:AraC-like DNA-binding protein
MSPIRYREYAPTPRLRSILECVWMVWDSRSRTARPADRVIPDGCPELIVHLGDAFHRRIGARWIRQPRAFLAGTLTRPWWIRGGRRMRTLGVRFRPGAVTAVFPIRMARAADREISLVELSGGPAASALMRSLSAARDPRHACAMAERWIAERAAEARPPRGHEATMLAVRAILTGHGRRRIGEVAASLGLGARRMERAFARDLGIRPKLFARIVRLNAALAMLRPEERTQAVDWALEAGYFDQAHLARDFRTVAGRRALAPRAHDGAFARHFTEPRRLLAFLAGE